MTGICTAHPGRHEPRPDCVQWDGSEETRLREELAEARRRWRQLVDDMEANSVDGWAAAARAATARATAAESALADSRVAADRYRKDLEASCAALAEARGALTECRPFVLMAPSGTSGRDFRENCQRILARLDAALALAGEHQEVKCGCLCHSPTDGDFAMEPNDACAACGHLLRARAGEQEDPFAYVAALVAKLSDKSDGHSWSCSLCGQPANLGAGLEPTEVCDLCAQQIAEAVISAVRSRAGEPKAAACAEGEKAVQGEPASSGQEVAHGRFQERTDEPHQPLQQREREQHAGLDPRGVSDSDAGVVRLDGQGAREVARQGAGADPRLATGNEVATPPPGEQGKGADPRGRWACKACGHDHLAGTGCMRARFAADGVTFESCDCTALPEQGKGGGEGLRGALKLGADALGNIACNQCGYTPDDPPDLSETDTPCDACESWLKAYTAMRDALAPAPPAEHPAIGGERLVRTDGGYSALEDTEPHAPTPAPGAGEQEEGK